MKDVLIAVVGTTPQIITETVWYLTQRRKVSLSEVLVLTTTVGRELLEEAFFRRDIWHRFCLDYHLDVDFSPRRIHVLTCADGTPMRDIRTPRENQDAGDFIVRFLRKQTSEPETRLYCSVAGGRKTMSVLLAFALQLCGRPQDELLHVLVSPPELERCKEFFYPPVEETCFEVDSHLIPSKEIEIEVATVPFVRLGHLVESRWLEQEYSSLVKQTQQHLSDIRVCLDLKDRQLLFSAEDRSVEVRLGEKKTKGSHLTALQAAYYSWALLRTKNHPLCRRYDDSTLIQKLYDHLYRAGQRTRQRRISPSGRSQMRRKLEQALEAKFLPEVIARIQVEPRTEKIPLDPSRIEIRGDIS